jgi:CDP-diacylglycerol pyrophosphatase
MRISLRKRLCVYLAAAGAGAIVLVSAGRGQAYDPDRLWRIVHDKCVPNQEQHADPAPCALVDLKEGVERGHVIFKDDFGASTAAANAPPKAANAERLVTGLGWKDIHAKRG